jgi:hypothetical protein
MLDRQKVEAILGRRFPGATRDQVAAAANAIMGLADDWEEVMHCSAGCGDGVHAQASDEPFEFRLFRRRLN